LRAKLDGGKDRKEHTVDQGATISQDAKYRYDLWRRWDSSLEDLVFIMMHPSTADADINDATIEICIDVAKHLNTNGRKYGGIYVVNIFAYRSKEPENLLEAVDPVGQENMTYIKKALQNRDRIICAWGSKCSDKLQKLCPQLDTVKAVLRTAANLESLKVNADSEPHQPLFLEDKYLFNPQKFEIK
jgi:hypothetical protein